MRIAFFHTLYENIGIEHLSAILRDSGHETRLFFDPRLFRTFFYRNDYLDRSSQYKDRLVEEAVDFKPDLVCISATTIDYPWGRIIARKIKEKADLPVIFGGIHPTSVPEKVISEDFIDFVCVGEGEEALLELVTALEQGRKTTDIANIWTKEKGTIISNPPRRLISDLDSLPLPDKELFYNEYIGFNRVYSIISSRGCPLSCTYCFNNCLKQIYKDKGVYLRRRSVENIIAELLLAKEKYDIERVVFRDDEFVNDVRWLREFSGKYKEQVGLPFFCEVYPSFVDEEVVTLLKNSGCLTINMGIQTISEDLRHKYLERQDKNEQIKESIRLFKKNRIFVHLDIILGLPGQDENEALDIASFFNQWRPNLISVFWLKYYPRTDIVDIARNEGLLTDKDIENIENGRLDELLKNRKEIGYNSDLSKVANLIFISYLIPRKLMSFIIRKKLYRYFPTQISLLWQGILICFIEAHSRIFEGTNRISQFAPFIVIRFYANYIIRALIRR